MVWKSEFIYQLLSLTVPTAKKVPIIKKDWTINRDQSVSSIP